MRRALSIQAVALARAARSRQPRPRPAAGWALRTRDAAPGRVSDGSTPEWSGSNNRSLDRSGVVRQGWHEANSRTGGHPVPQATRRRRRVIHSREDFMDLGYFMMPAHPPERKPYDWQQTDLQNLPLGDEMGV